MPENLEARRVAILDSVAAWMVGYGGVQRIVGLLDGSGCRRFPDAFEIWMDGDQDRPAIVVSGRHVTHFESLQETSG